VELKKRYDKFMFDTMTMQKF